MPIHPDLRQYYGRAHRAYRAYLIGIFGPYCWHCRRLCERYLNLAHLTHDPRHYQRVALLCPACHARNDAGHSAAIRRGSEAVRSGQLWILPEMEIEHYRPLLIPAAVLAKAQGRLFAA